MMCQNCGRNNANVMYESVINGDRTTLHLCDECASRMNLGIDFDFGINDIFSNFFEDFGGLRMLTMPDLMGRERYALPSFTNLKTKNNSLDEFDEILERNRQKKNIKKEVKVKELSKVEKLKAELSECIKNEEYEKAATLRDEIKKLEK